MINLMRRPAVCRSAGISPSTLDRRMAEGLFTRPIPDGPRNKVWPDYEVDALNRAKVAGKTDDEIRALVARLHSERLKLAA